MSGRSGLHVTLLALLALLVLLAVPGCGDGASPQLDRMAEEHRGDRGDVPGAAAGAGEALPVRVEEVVYGEIDGAPLRGYLARPPQGSRGGPAILVIHEWWGLNDNIRAMARQLAAEGYTALAVDLYEGRSSADPAEARRLAGEAMSRARRVETNLRLARTHLEERFEPAKVGVIGWCFGARVAIQQVDGLDLLKHSLNGNPGLVRVQRKPGQDARAKRHLWWTVSRRQHAMWWAAFPRRRCAPRWHAVRRHPRI